MTNQAQIQEFVLCVEASWVSNTFVKITLGHYTGQEAALKRVLIKKITIKKGDRLSFTYRYKTKDEVKNYTLEDGLLRINDLLGNGFNAASLFTIENDIVYQSSPHGHGAKVRMNKPTYAQLPDLAHDKKKKRLIPSNRPYLADLKISSAQGHVFQKTQDKFRQINRYIELLKIHLEALSKNTEKKEIVVADMGSGKGYLSFALYDYMAHHLKLNTHMTGVELRKDLVEQCNRIAAKHQFKGLCFEQSDIQSYEDDTLDALDILIALHACDTATDDAIVKGIKHNAQLIVVAPCCQKQIRKNMKPPSEQSALKFLSKYGIFEERLAELFTDGIRAKILNYFGYSTKVVEFISDQHTPKNVMIIAEKSEQIKLHEQSVLAEISAAKQLFGIEQHYLEAALSI